MFQLWILRISGRSMERNVQILNGVLNSLIWKLTNVEQIRNAQAFTIKVVTEWGPYTYACRQYLKAEFCNLTVVITRF